MFLEVFKALFIVLPLGVPVPLTCLYGGDETIEDVVEVFFSEVGVSCHNAANGAR